MAKCRFTYAFQPGVCASDNVSQTALLELPILNCSDKTGLPTSCEQLFNQNLCAQDIEYFTPICLQEGRFGIYDAKYLFFQLRFFIPDTERTKGWQLSLSQPQYYIKVEAYDCCCLPLEGFDATTLIYKANTFRVADAHFQNVQLDVTTLPDCFILKFSTSDGKVGFSQAYKKDCCNGEVKLEGVNKTYDCEGRYYSLPEAVDTGNGDLFYRNIVRFLSEPYLSSESISRNTNKNVQLSVEVTEKIAIRSFKMPEYEVRNVISVLSADEILLSGSGITDRDYTFAGDIAKSLEVSTMWVLDFELTRVNCTKQTKC